MMKFHDIAANDDLSIRLRDKFFPGMPIVTVKRISSGKTGDCYHNVREYIKLHGGSAQLGWVICHWPKRFVEGLHHAVWRSPEGVLFDVTDHAYPGLAQDEVAFIEETPFRQLGDADVFTPSWFWLLNDSPGLKHYTRLMRERVNLMRRIYEYGARNGKEVRENGRLGYAFDPSDTFPNKLASEHEAVSRLCDRYWNQFQRTGSLAAIK